MPVPFRDSEEIKELGLAAYLKVEPDPTGYRGALFLINVQGEPVEFTYTRINIPHTFLWRQSDIRIHSARQLTASLFASGKQSPRLLFCLAGEIGGELFCHDINVEVPVCRIAHSDASVSCGRGEVKEETMCSEPKQLFWFPSRPAEDSCEYRLFQRIVSSGLLAEPFERAAAGLREAYK